VEGLIAIGDLSLDGLLLSRSDISQVLAVAANAGFRVALLAAEDAERLSEPGCVLPSLELLPAQSLGEAVAFALR
jgi:hypothetical protein